MQQENFQMTEHRPCDDACVGYYVTSTFLEAIKRSGVTTLEPGWSGRLRQYLSTDSLLDAAAMDEYVFTHHEKLALRSRSDRPLMDLFRDGSPDIATMLSDPGFASDIDNRRRLMWEQNNQDQEVPYSLDDADGHFWVDKVLFVAVSDVAAMASKPQDARIFYRNCLESCVHGLNSPAVLCSRLYEQFVSFS